MSTHSKGNVWLLDIGVADVFAFRTLQNWHTIWSRMEHPALFLQVQAQLQQNKLMKYQSRPSLLPNNLFEARRHSPPPKPCSTQGRFGSFLFLFLHQATLSWAISKRTDMLSKGVLCRSHLQVRQVPGNAGWCTISVWATFSSQVTLRGMIGWRLEEWQQIFLAFTQSWLSPLNSHLVIICFGNLPDGILHTPTLPPRSLVRVDTYAIGFIWNSSITINPAHEILYKCY